MRVYRITSLMIPLLLDYLRKAERIFGTRKYLAIYAGAGVLANAFTFLGGSAPYSLGASGSIFGVMGAIGAFYWLNRKALGGRADMGKTTRV